MNRTIDPVVLPRLALLIPALVLLSATVADPDLWGHLRFGADILAARALPLREVYSFTSDRPWVNHEWLAEVIFAATFAAGGAAGLITLRLALLAAMLLLVARALRGIGGPPLARDLLLFFAAAGTHPAAGTVRPQLFSLLAFASLLSCMVEYERRGWRALALAPVVMALWANLHGGWLVGLGALAVWGTMTMATLFTSGPTLRAPWNATRKSRLANEAAPLVAALLAAACATAVNPYGIGLWRFMVETVSFTRADITEWQPLTGAIPATIGLWVMACALGVVGVMARDATARPRPGAIAVLALLALASFRVLRLVPFFVLSAVTFAGPALVVLARARARPGSATATGAATAGPSQPGPPEPPQPRAAIAPPPATQVPAPLWVLALTLVLTFVLVDGTLRRTGRFGCIDASDPRLPEPDVGAFLRDSVSVRGRMLTWFDWGEYAIWHFAPRVQVSIDGRRETVYSEVVLHAHHEFYSNRDNLALLDRLRPDVVWLQRDLPVVPSLDARGWRRVFDGSRSVVFRPPGAGELEEGGPEGPRLRGTPPQGPACFPG